ncbi:aldehyde dehydrogenase family protein [Actinomadura madurae]|uniref:aldehyde dehydrogenase family protein n=1 Tax=Actinomadura madurae TaxID=1993 RepID=UPI0020D222EB|nr:aldehyde dehydrogenase family protein [Actinomadura madurae]
MTLLDPGIWTGKIFDGGWTAGDGGVYDVTEPATGGTLGTLGEASAADVARAARSAAAAQRDWAARTYEERAAVLREAGRLFVEHAAEIGGWIVRETGAIPRRGTWRPTSRRACATRRRRWRRTRRGWCCRRRSRGGAWRGAVPPGSSR